MRRGERAFALVANEYDRIALARSVNADDETMTRFLRSYEKSIEPFVKLMIGIMNEAATLDAEHHNEVRNLVSTEISDDERDVVAIFFRGNASATEEFRQWLGVEKHERFTQAS